ncbi:hypothetical protein ACROYT_G022841 [Oculina patagonica]
MLEELVFVSRQIIQLFTTSPELTKTTHDFEALWVEMQNGSQRNMICSVIYLHPNGYIQNFMDNLNSTVVRIHRKDKFCITLGDFNLDLLKLENRKLFKHLRGPLVFNHFPIVKKIYILLFPIILRSNNETIFIFMNLL